MKVGDETKPHDLSRLKIDYTGGQNQRIRKPALFSLLVIIAAAILAYYIIARKQPIEVSVALAQISGARSSRTTLNASGYVTPLQRSTIASKITGRIMELNANEGRFVEKGNVLARLDDSDAKVQVETAQANLEVAKASTSELEVNLIYAKQTLERYKKLFSKKVVSQQNLDECQRSADALEAKIKWAQKEIEAAQARLKAARQELENYTITAPFSGLIVFKNAQIGEMVSPVSAGGGYTRTGIVTIVDMQSLNIEVDVNESNIAQVKVGQNATAALDAYPEWKIPAKVRTIIPSVDRQKATVKVLISFDLTDPRILPDMGVKVTFLEQNDQIGESSPLIEIPHEALREENGQNFVYLFDQGVIERRLIVPGQNSGAFVEVLDGISANDKVVISNVPNIKNGQKAKLANK